MTSIKLAAQFEGVFTMRALKGGNVVREREFKNLITNQGLNRLGSLGSNFLWGGLHVGTGTAVPQFTDQSLANPLPRPDIASTSYDNSIVGTPADDEFYAQLTTTWLTQVGALGNNNLTEIGVGYTTADSLWSRALILDAQGNPTAFPINADEQLQVSYQLRNYIPKEDAVFEVDVSGPRVATVRAIHPTMWYPPRGNTGTVLSEYSGGTFFDGGLASITDNNPNGSAISGGAGSRSTAPYENNSLRRRGRTDWSSSQANSNQLRTQKVQWGAAAFQVQYDPPIEKTSEQSMYLEYEITWGRR